MLSGTTESYLTDVITNNKKYQPGNFDNIVSTSKIAMFVIQSLTITPFFTDPASLIRVAGRGGLKDYLQKTALPGKQDTAESAGGNMLDITTSSSLNNSAVAYLRKQGNRLGLR